LLFRAHSKSFDSFLPNVLDFLLANGNPLPAR